jgi:hypothetical protein
VVAVQPKSGSSRGPIRCIVHGIIDFEKDPKIRELFIECWDQTTLEKSNVVM